MNAKRYPLPAKLALAAEALVALAHARMRLPGTRPDDVLRCNEAVARQTASRNGTMTRSTIAERCAEVAFIIPRLAVRLPWRADCLVQALAGQRMLLKRGIAGEIAVGTAKHPDGTFEAHAWLTYGSEVILGGDISRFSPLLDSKTVGTHQS